ncbi:MAG: aldose epimerase family protein [Clostridia bacterium]
MIVENFGEIDGQPISIFTLATAEAEAKVTNYGATVLSISVADKFGKRRDVALGYSSLEEYRGQDGYLGATIGRYGNRIGGATFSLGGIKYSLYKNDGNNCLHGGKDGFNAKVWKSQIKGDASVAFVYISPDGEEGFPGTLKVKVLFTLIGATLRIEYFAVTDMATPINITNHTYFNLNGENSGSIEEHYIKIYSHSYTPIDKELIVKGTAPLNKAMDFTNFKKIGLDINDTTCEQIKFGGGYDHNFILDIPNGVSKCAEVYSQESGISMLVTTDQPGVQFYTGNFLDGRLGKSKTPYNKRSGLCLETQNYPNAVNIMGFPDPVLQIDENYYSVTEYKFGIKAE